MLVLKKWLKHPFTITSIIVGALIVFIPFPFPQYKLDSTFKVFNNSRLVRAYCDFDNDGVSEFIRFYSTELTGRGSRFIVTESSGSLLYRSFLDERFGNVSLHDNLYFDDFWGTGNNSVSFFSRSNDSLFMFVFSLADTLFTINGYPVKEFKDEIAYNTMQTKWLGNTVNGNGDPLLYFLIDQSVDLNMGEVVCLNLNTLETKRFIFEALHPQVYFHKNDSNGARIIINTVSNKNITDDFAWEYAAMECKLFFLDENFEPFAEAVTLAKSYGYADMEVLNNKVSGKHEIFTFLWDFGINKRNFQISKFNFNGQKVYAKQVESKKLFRDLLVIRDKSSELFVVSEEKEYWLLNGGDGTLSKTFKSQLNLDGLTYVAAIQLDTRDDLEHVLLNETSKELIVAREGFKNPVSFIVDDESFVFDKIDVRKGDPYSLVLPGNVYFNRLTYQSTIWRWLKYPFWFGLFLVLNLLVWLRVQLKRKKMLEIKAIERKITDLQLKNFRNQLDPHFTFNALNVIGSVIYKEDRDVAYDYFTRFSRLMRSSLMDSTKITRELEAELQFTLDYLEFQIYRFKDKFEFSIDVDEGIDLKMQVPKMLIQGYVENAIRHGFHLIKYKGIISIRLSREDTGFLISIKDNGIGREESARLNPNKQIGRGMNIMEEQVSLFNKYNPNSIELKITDLKNGGQAAGTLIEILIPDKYSFSISKPSR